MQVTIGDYNKTTHYVRDASGNVLATAVQATYNNGVLSARNNSIAIGKDDEVKGSGNDWAKQSNHITKVFADHYQLTQNIYGKWTY